MELHEYARQVLLSPTIDAKLAIPATLTDQDPMSGRLDVVPDFPNRAQALQPTCGKPDKFPSIEALSDPRARGRVFHFFANHELLALELMALVLLRFPAAPRKFRVGLAQIMKEEQQHALLYLEQMQRYGVEFGSLAVNRFFWDALARCQKPIQFVAGMSLTFEQANLDFAEYFSDRFNELGDTRAVQVLRQVYEDEIGHVGHGLYWLREWGNPQTDDWENYVANLLPPLTPARGRGHVFARAARLQAGFSEEFITKVQNLNKAGFQLQNVWIPNLLFDLELAAGKEFSLPRGLRPIAEEMAQLVLWLGHRGDGVLLAKTPSKVWHDEMSQVGWELPYAIPDHDPHLHSLIRHAQPQAWGWSVPACQQAEKILTSTARADEMEKQGRHWRQLNSITHKTHAKTWAFEINAQLSTYLGPDPRIAYQGRDYATIFCSNADTLSEILANRSHRQLVFKAAYGFSGRNQRILRLDRDCDANTRRWLEKQAHTHGLIVEEFLDVRLHLSPQMAIRPDGIHCLGIHHFLCDSSGQFAGSILHGLQKWVSPAILRFLNERAEHYGHRNVYEIVQETAQLVGTKLQQEGYLGPYSVDAFIFAEPTGQLKIRPLVEVNVRYTMGHIAERLKRKVHRSGLSLWLILSKKQIAQAGFKEFAELYNRLKVEIPRQQGRRGLLNRGVIPTMDIENSSIGSVLIACRESQDIELLKRYGFIPSLPDRS